MLLHQDLKVQFIILKLEIVKKTLTKTIKTQQHTLSCFQRTQIFVTASVTEFLICHFLKEDAI